MDRRWAVYVAVGGVLGAAVRWSISEMSPTRWVPVGHVLGQPRGLLAAGSRRRARPRTPAPTPPRRRPGRRRLLRRTHDDVDVRGRGR
ncbi:MAG: hypothetical protein U5R31_16355 [Acidimicrobiia bacterium]|nr:hypothetical protein [Acidimicrobiia bacterium]